MPGLSDLPDLSARISGVLSERGIAHAITGAMALSAHGFTRATRDLDLLVVTTALRMPEVFAVVRDFGFEGDDATLLRDIREKGVAEFRSGPISVEILAPVLPFHRTIPSRALKVNVSGTEVPFVSAEDLVILKLLWLRDKDRADLRALVAARGASLDLTWIRERLAEMVPVGDERWRFLETLLGR